MHRPPRSRTAQGYHYRRTYKACIPCRERKVKCRIVNEHPCARCAKMGIECQFTAKKPWARETTDSLDSRRTETLEHSSGPGSTSGIPHICYPMTTDGNTSRLHRIVSNHNDALDILFHIVSPENRDTNRQSIRATANQALPQDADPHPEVLRMWNACRFVKMGWFTAREAITLVDFFFRRIAPYTPIVTDFYSYHSNHYWLITQEPTLCCVILLISSRHDVLAKAGGSSRGHSIHNRLWQHCQHLILRIMLGQEKLSKAKTRHIGSIEALLLLAEWYPRALHFPPENDGWDSDLILTVPDKRDPPATSEETVTLKDRWREDVIEPTRRTDRMAWMVLSSALALSHELDVFRPKPESMYQSKDEGTMPSSSKSNTQSQNSNANSTTVLGPGLDVDIYLKHLERRRRRLPPLLLVYVNLLAARIGCTSPMATILPPEVWERLIDSAEDLEWVRFMASWVELTRLAKGIADQYFPLVSMSAEQRQHTKSLDRWRDCLADWQDRRPRLLQENPLNDILNIDYHYLVIFINSIKMQSMVTEKLWHADTEVRQALKPRDLECVEEIVASSCSILQWITRLGEQVPSPIQYLPISVFHRVISTSIFLLKGLALGVRTVRARECLDLLDEVSQALQIHALDDIHLVARYATLLKIHLERFGKSFNNTSAPDSDEGAVSAASTDHPAVVVGLDNGGSPRETATASQENMIDQQIFEWSDGLVAGPDDWLSWPLDPLMAPFGTWDETGQPDLGLDSSYMDLDFIWNLPP